MNDIQSAPDLRNLAIQRVGVKSVRHPVLFEDLGAQAQPSVGLFDMYVGLSADKKGTHMSRFLEILGTQPVKLCLSSAHQFLDSMMTRLGSTSADFTVQFPFFIEKTAPISKAKSLLDLEVVLSAKCIDGELSSYLQLVIPVTSLCPCSKAISEYGAHNQRSHITLEVKFDTAHPVSVSELITMAESQASAGLYGLLKRPDEKYVTEQAYDNPKFVEDLVRDLAAALSRFKGVEGYQISSENFESIHNHSAYAQLSHNWS